MPRLSPVPVSADDPIVRYLEGLDRCPSRPSAVLEDPGSAWWNRLSKAGVHDEPATGGVAAARIVPGAGCPYAGPANRAGTALPAYARSGHLT
jgi:hypothetical protein